MKIDKIEGKQVNITKKMKNGTINYTKHNEKKNNVKYVLLVPIIGLFVIVGTVAVVKWLDITTFLIVPIVILLIIFIGVISFFVLRTLGLVKEKTLLDGLRLFLNKLSLATKNKDKNPTS